jgi:Arc/MetJ family transcription regulator
LGESAEIGEVAGVLFGEDGALRRCRNLVYDWCMSRTNIDLDDEACQRVMDRYQLSTKREAVNMALRHLAGEPLSLEQARSLRGTGWDGDLDEMRASRV